MPETIFVNSTPIKNDEQCFYFMLKPLFIFEILTFLSFRFGYVESHLDKKTKVNFKIYDLIDWLTNTYNAYITQYLKK